MRQIAVVTEVCGGRGDVAAAAKVIELMLQITPRLAIDWVLFGIPTEATYRPEEFLEYSVASRVSIRDNRSETTFLPASTIEPVDLVVFGPVPLICEKRDLEIFIKRKIAGPVFGFLENGGDRFTKGFHSWQLNATSSSCESYEEIYEKIHLSIFSSQSSRNRGLLPMGLQPKSGVFLDEGNLNAVLSREYSCPSYLLEIQDEALLADILAVLGEEPDYNRYSFNAGYAHHVASWEKFIDCIAIQEEEKNVVIVANFRGAFTEKSTPEEFNETIFTPERLTFLQARGYGTVQFQSPGQPLQILQQANEGEETRTLTLIVHPQFTPHDMHCLQLAAERLLATGDNSAAESWCARCKLYLYEDVNNGGCKDTFLQQQVDLATEISPALGALLAIFGGDSRRESERLINEPFTNQQLQEIEPYLKDPELSVSTLQFCQRITKNYSFSNVLKAALKRTIWTSIIPNLKAIEAENMPTEFKTGIISYLQEKNEKSTIDISVASFASLKKAIGKEILTKISS